MKSSKGSLDQVVRTWNIPVSENERDIMNRHVEFDSQTNGLAFLR